ncbi:MAG: NUDIX domain-containing protein [Candidatus Rokubacteria bacterium]|nr:NUDIX domain-containing protein [Candidatus Rokubacteria bacterium]
MRRVRQEGLDRLRCRRCGWIFYGNPIPAAVALVVRAGRVLLGRRANAPYRGTWDLPGGFLEAGETPERGLSREMREELGARIRSARFLGFFHETYGPGGFPILAVVYRVRLAPGPLRRGSDVSELRWFPRRELPYRGIAFPSVRRALARFVAHRVRGKGRGK